MTTSRRGKSSSNKRESDYKLILLKRIKRWCLDYETDLDEAGPLLTIVDEDVNGFFMKLHVRATSSNLIDITVPYLKNPKANNDYERSKRDRWWQQILGAEESQVSSETDRRNNGHLYTVDRLGTEEWVVIRSSFHVTNDEGNDEGRWFRLTGDIYEAFTWLNHDLDYGEEIGLRFR